MKKLFLLIALLSSSGCLWQTVDNVEIKKAQDFCECHKGLYKITEMWVGSTLIECSDGTFIWEGELPK